MRRNDLGYPKPNASKQTKIDNAMSLFVQRAQNENRSYFGDMVRSNLGDYLQNGYTPQEAVDALFRRANRR